MDRPRPGRVLGVVGAAALLAGLSACGQTGGQALAQQACAHVKRSLQDYREADEAGVTTARAASLRLEADTELRRALPLAADANSDDGSWNSLMTTISESATIDEAHLAPALKAQCAVADTNVNVNPQ